MAWPPLGAEIAASDMEDRAGELAAAATVRTGEAAAELVARGLPVRDVAVLLGISPQRVSQLTARAS